MVPGDRCRCYSRSRRPRICGNRGMSLEQGRKVALEEYVSNYAAMGLDPDKTSVYFQSSRPEVQRLAFVLGRRTNLSELGSIYGFGGDTNLAHVQAPLVQVGDILHPMLDDLRATPYCSPSGR